MTQEYAVTNSLGAQKETRGMSDLDIVEFADNPDPRCPCVLLLDTSSSMQGQPVGALNEGMRVFQADVQTDELAQRRSEIALVTFGNGGVRVPLCE
jgi:hypothetical protein